MKNFYRLVPKKKRGKIIWTEVHNKPPRKPLNLFRGGIGETFKYGMLLSIQL